MWINREKHNANNKHCNCDECLQPKMFAFYDRKIEEALDKMNGVKLKKFIKDATTRKDCDA